MLGREVGTPLIPMVAITGKPSREWIHLHLAGLRQGGIEQFLLYPRSGCELEYMSEEWLAACEIFVEEAQKLGFAAIWLYDEFNWPSGQCGGKVQAAAPEFAIQMLKCISQPDGTWEFKITSNPRFPNLLNADAAALFIRLTHYVYAARFGSLLGTFIRGIFSDEPSSGYDAWYPYDHQGNRTIPYYPELEADYEALYHVPFRSDLRNPVFVERCQKVVGKRFRVNYLDRVREWCEKHNLLFTGHLMEEFSIRKSRNHSADPLLAISGFGMPGCDEVYTRLTTDAFEWLTFGTVQYGIKRRGNGGLAELFALGPADMPLARMSAMFNMAALFGVNHYVLAVSPLDFRGNRAIHSWFNPYSADQPWWDKMPLLAACAKKSARLALRKPAREVGIRYPFDCVEITELMKNLVKKQIPWHLIGTEEACSELEAEIIAPSLAGYRLERLGRSVVSIGEVLDILETEFQRKVAVFDESGRLDENVFVRVFADGGAFLQDMSDTASTRRVKVFRNGAETVVELHGRGGVELPAWQVFRSCGNMCRVSFDCDGNFEFELKEPMTLKLAIRSYAPIEVELDGVGITASGSPEWLPKGFRPLYQESILPLEAGKHLFHKISGDDIYAYLPSMWLSGDFALFDRTLQRDLHDGNGLSQFAGTLIQQGEVDIPCNSAGMLLDTDEFVTELLIDGQTLGTRIERPFFWHIPAEFLGRRVKLEIRRQTSLAPIFGNVRYFRNCLPTWFDFPLGEYPVKHPVVEVDFMVESISKRQALFC